MQIVIVTMHDCLGLTSVAVNLFNETELSCAVMPELRIALKRQEKNRKPHAAFFAAICKKNERVRIFSGAVLFFLEAKPIAMCYSVLGMYAQVSTGALDSRERRSNAGMHRNIGTRHACLPSRHGRL